MSISSEINRIAQNVSDSLDAVAAKGVTVPTGSTSDDLPDLIAQITGGGGGTSWEQVYSGQINLSSDWGGGVNYASINPFDETIALNSVWRVTWDNVQYECTATWEGGDTTEGNPYAIGNYTYDGGSGGNNEPFYMQKYWGTYLIIVGASGWHTVVIEKQVSGGGGGSTLVPKTITANGTYDPADDNADGYSEVIVNVGTTWETVYNGQLNINQTDDGTYFYNDIPYSGDIELNSVWRVTWNGTPYECVATSIGDPVGIPYAIGNDTIIHEQGGNNEPFFIQRIFASPTLFVFASQSGTVNLVVEKQISSGGSTLITKTITANGTYNPADDDADGYSEVTVAVPSGSPNLQAKTNISPTTSSQTVQADSGYDGLSSVQINAMPSGTAGTPTATKGTVSNHSISVTPSVTNTTGYITGSTKTGTAVTVSASELVSGSETKTANGTYDVTNLASLVVNVASGGGGIGTLLNTTSIGDVSSTSTQAASLNISLEVTGINSYDLLIVESSVNSVTNNRHTATVGIIFLTASSSVDTKNGANIATAKWNSKISSNGTTTTNVSTTAYGIYPNSCSISSGTASIPMYRRYNSTSTGTINGTYTARVYGVKLYDLIGG